MRDPRPGGLAQPDAGASPGSAGAARVPKGNLVARNAPVRVALALFVALAASLYLTSGFIAKYVSADNGDDAARAAGFAFNLADGDPHVVNLADAIKKPGDFADYTFTVSSAGEVSQQYRLYVELDGSMPVAVAVKEGPSYSDGAATVLSSTVKELDAQMRSATHAPLAKRSSVRSAAPNASAAQAFTLRATWPKSETVSATTTSYEDVDYANNAMGVLKVRAVAEQVD